MKNKRIWFGWIFIILALLALVFPDWKFNFTIDSNEILRLTFSTLFAFLIGIFLLLKEKK